MVNANFAKVGAMGITHTVATGDSGAHGRTDGGCSTSKVHPAFPAASPYLTAVGATMVPDGQVQSGFKDPVCNQIQCLGAGTETVCSKSTGALITSGGGFSEYTPRMQYQDKVVSEYLKESSNLPPAGAFNASGRGFPDIAALGHQYYIELNGQVVAVDGTSASCPVNAGILSLINAELVRQGKAKLGFANPTIYKVFEANPKAFNGERESIVVTLIFVCCDVAPALLSLFGCLGFRLARWIRWPHHLSPPLAHCLPTAPSCLTPCRRYRNW